jgi:hypothetical protein
MAEYVVVGLDSVLARMQAELGPLMTAKVARGLELGGIAIQGAARQNLASHHFEGTAENQTTVSPPLISGHSVAVTVGIHGGLAPEGRPLEFGWKSDSGKMPPVLPIAEWLVKKGIGQDRNAKGFVSYGKGGKSARVAEAGFGAAFPGSTVSMAFLIARKIQKRGYSFAPLHWLERAMTDRTPAVLAALEKECQV